MYCAYCGYLAEDVARCSHERLPCRSYVGGSLGPFEWTSEAGGLAIIGGLRCQNKKIYRLTIHTTVDNAAIHRCHVEGCCRCLINHLWVYTSGVYAYNYYIQ